MKGIGGLGYPRGASIASLGRLPSLTVPETVAAKGRYCLCHDNDFSKHETIEQAEISAVKLLCLHFGMGYVEGMHLKWNALMYFDRLPCIFESQCKKFHIVVEQYTPLSYRNLTETV